MTDEEEKIGKSDIIIIPAYQPDEKLVDLVGELIENGFKKILLVNDGSDKRCDLIFRKIEERNETTVLSHEKNKGKGAALKTAISFIIRQGIEKQNIITIDADGQHRVEDIIAVSKQIEEKKGIVLGVRNFSKKEIPFRSKFGNKLTSFIFFLFLGMKLKDTQTGLRAFPSKILKDLVTIEGDRYEYETNVLIYLQKKRIPYFQTEISTVYLEQNKSSHFRVVRDSMKIYGIILKYLFSSLGGAVIDEVLFYLFKKSLHITGGLPVTVIAAVLARILSSLFNYWMNAKQVFKGIVSVKTMAKYYILATVQILLSGSIVLILEKFFKITSAELLTVLKVIVDSVLFFGSFQIQHKWVFLEEKGN